MVILFFVIYIDLPGYKVTDIKNIAKPDDTDDEVR